MQAGLRPRGPGLGDDGGNEIECQADGETAEDACAPLPNGFGLADGARGDEVRRLKEEEQECCGEEGARGERLKDRLQRLFADEMGETRRHKDNSRKRGDAHDQYGANSSAPRPLAIVVFILMPMLVMILIIMLAALKIMLVQLNLQHDGRARTIKDDAACERCSVELRQQMLSEHDEVGMERRVVDAEGDAGPGIVIDVQLGAQAHLQGFEQVKVGALG
mmetsp:Transcript_1264/g.4050  ORF Transcript_1264/g.4050 Transcript_1264/m.4050 type:complete len:220 (+) Transcript_1264:772-1431(+)